jgi:hypothetical protein
MTGFWKYVETKYLPNSKISTASQSNEEVD